MASRRGVAPDPGRLRFASPSFVLGEGALEDQALQREHAVCDDRLAFAEARDDLDFADGAFADQWSGQTMAEVFDYVSTQMPENDPGGLRPQEYADVLAYILSVNAYPAGIEELPVDKAALKLLGIAPNPK